MLNLIWALMILTGIVTGICTGRIEQLGNGALESAGNAVTLCITMLGILSLWMGLMQVARASGLLGHLAKGMKPVVRFLFPGLPKESKAGEYIAANMIANILGLGWAATPAGIQAMQELEALEEQRRKNRQKAAPPGTASREMCVFLIMNISSLQLIPVNMIAYRSQYGSANPAGILMPAILATFVSTFVAVLYCKFKTRKSE